MATPQMKRAHLKGFIATYLFFQCGLRIGRCAMNKTVDVRPSRSLLVVWVIQERPKYKITLKLLDFAFYPVWMDIVHSIRVLALWSA